MTDRPPRETYKAEGRCTSHEEEVVGCMWECEKEG